MDACRPGCCCYCCCVAWRRKRYISTRQSTPYAARKTQSFPVVDGEGTRGSGEEENEDGSWKSRGSCRFAACQHDSRCALFARFGRRRCSAPHLPRPAVESDVPRASSRTLKVGRRRASDTARFLVSIGSGDKLRRHGSSISEAKGASRFCPWQQCGARCAEEGTGGVGRSESAEEVSVGDPVLLSLHATYLLSVV